MGGAGSKILFGLHAVRHALQSSPENLLELFIQRDRKDSAEIGKLIQQAESAGVSRQYLGRAALDRKSGNARHQGVLAVARSVATAGFASVDELVAGDRGDLLVLVLDGVQDPHNLGACIRTANAAGVDAVIIPRDNAASLNATVSKVASGAAEHTPLLPVTNIARSLRQLQQAGVWVVGTDADAERSIYELELGGPTAIVMGGEGRGLRHNTKNHCDHLARLPMRGQVESLNVSVATGICLFEVLRQRGAEPQGQGSPASTAP